MITLFDIPSTAPGSAWSLNPWRTRLALAYKGIPFRTEWVEYPDIRPVLQSHNIQPTGKLADGSGYYSVPAILDIDDATGEVNTALADSFPIVKYLDEAYPDTPRLIPEGTSEDQETFARGYIRSILPILIIMIKVGLPKLNERSQDHYSTARAEDLFPLFKVKRVEKWPWSEEDQAKHWADAKKALDALDEKLTATDAKGPWYLGDRISFADFVIGASLIWMELLLGEESEEWKNVTTWNGGRWKRFIEGISEWRVKGLKN
ncbi:hypothetical protein FA13DRAFT_1736220 [Coprinellus micaceus]|uniref:GST N-terminal domain-containing protein n=1 Tax=Coprinellus micaceus TaxID=71717 RepID=A0A4Y7T0S3_COPMI|nr:hypothetical protein FA13DRAFT_1736220 [Coprinellus micaceus]